MPYDLITPLFSDDALKRRAVFVPPGKEATCSADGAFEFPTGTVLLKSFGFWDDLPVWNDPAAGTNEQRKRAYLTWHRMHSVDPGVAMPQIGRSTEHVQAVAMVRQWITELPKGSCNP